MSNLPTWPCFTEEEGELVKSVLLSNNVNYWTGQECRKFEKEYAQYIGTEYAVAVSNGTVAIEIALEALDVGVGDEVIVTPRSFFASVSAVVRRGASPVFADVCSNSQNIEASYIKPLINPKTKAIIVVHLAGMPADMDAINLLAKEHGIYVIEDCAQAHGAIYKGKKVGALGDVATWSFCQDKIITTGGEGGMITTNSEKVWRKSWSIKDHGKDWDAVYNKQHPPGFRWLHTSFGSNYRMTEIQAAIGRYQLSILEDMVAKRRANAARIYDAVERFQSVKVPSVPEDIRHAYYRAYISVDNKFLVDGWNRDRLVESINQKGVPCFQGSCAAIYKEDAFSNRSLSDIFCPNSEALGETSIMFLVHPNLTEKDMDFVCSVINDIFSHASL